MTHWRSWDCGNRRGSMKERAGFVQAGKLNQQQHPFIRNNYSTEKWEDDFRATEGYQQDQEEGVALCTKILHRETHNSNGSACERRPWNTSQTVLNTYSSEDNRDTAETGLYYRTPVLFLKVFWTLQGNRLTFIGRVAAYTRFSCHSSQQYTTENVK